MQEGFHPLKSNTSKKLFFHCEVDPILNIPESTDGYTAILMYVDVCSRFCILNALKGTKMETVAAAIWEIFFVCLGPQRSCKVTMVRNMSTKFSLHCCNVSRWTTEQTHNILPRLTQLRKGLTQRLKRLFVKCSMVMSPNGKTYYRLPNYVVIRISQLGLNKPHFHSFLGANVWVLINIPLSNYQNWTSNI